MSNLTQEQRTAILGEWAEFRRGFSDEAPPRETARSWGFEIETPDADELHEALSRENRGLLNFTQDSSIEGAGSDECECDCRWCLYHECDCDSCEVEGSDDPEHGCGSNACYSDGTEFQEITTLAGGVKTTHPQELAVLVSAGLETARITEQCGLHLNIGSADLNPAQVSRVISAYRISYDLLTVIAGRESERYAPKPRNEYEAMAHRGESTGKFTAVNTQHHYHNLSQYGDKNTARLEFRQHEGTNNPAEIRAWAWLMVELVEFAKSTRPLYWLAQAKTLDQFRKALR
jgi:hypothetical protein